MKREVIIKIDRCELFDILSDYLTAKYTGFNLAQYPRFWADILDAKGQTLIDDEKCPETFTFHFADAL